MHWNCISLARLFAVCMVVTSSPKKSFSVSLIVPCSIPSRNKVILLNKTPSYKGSKINNLQYEWLKYFSTRHIGKLIEIASTNTPIQINLIFEFGCHGVHNNDHHCIYSSFVISCNILDINSDTVLSMCPLLQLCVSQHTYNYMQF